MIQSFINKRNQVMELVEDIKNSGLLSEEALTESELNESLGRLESGAFKVALIAPFTAGKSTFVNGLIGEDLLSRNILAETAAITTLKYGKKKSIQVQYYDGSSEELVENQENTIDDLKSFLKQKTTVNREVEDDQESANPAKVEDIVRAVDVYWDVDLLKDGVEIVDTPGLYSRHKEHEDITQRILTEAQAILFLISPDSVGEVHFTEFISGYVENAKRSNLDSNGKHIFFVINKIDRYRSEEIAHAREELLKVLSPILPNPQIIEVSSYFAMKSRMFENGDISLQELQIDRDILFIDKDTGYPIMGQMLTEEKVSSLKTISQIQEVEKVLAEYFEYKNNYLMEEIISVSLNMLGREQDHVQQRIQVLQNHFDRNEKDYTTKISLLKDRFTKKAKALKKDILKKVTEDFVYDAAGESKIHTFLRGLRKNEIPILSDQVRIHVMQAWRARKSSLNKNNGNRLMTDLTEQLSLSIQTAKKAFIQKAFQRIEYLYSTATDNFFDAFQDFEEDFLKALIIQLDLKPIENQTSFFDSQQVINPLKQEIEQLFKGASLESTSGLDNKIDELIEDNTTTRRKAGFWNLVKSFVGKAEQEEVFNTQSFRYEFEDLINQFIDEGIEELKVDISRIEIVIEDKISIITESMQSKLMQRIDHFQNWRNRNLEQLKEELSVEKADTEHSIAMLKGKIETIDICKQDVEKRYDEIIKEEEQHHEIQSVS